MVDEVKSKKVEDQIDSTIKSIEELNGALNFYKVEVEKLTTMINILISSVVTKTLRDSGVLESTAEIVYDLTEKVWQELDYQAKVVNGGSPNYLDYCQAEDLLNTLGADAKKRFIGE